MSDVGGIYVPWYLYVACAVVWLFALIGVAFVARVFWQFTRPFRPFLHLRRRPRP